MNLKEIIIEEKHFSKIHQFFSTKIKQGFLGVVGDIWFKEDFHIFNEN
jgi:hypothetical protein